MLPKKTKEPGILKKARMELLAEGNRKAAARGAGSVPCAAVPSTSQPAEPGQQNMPADAAMLDSAAISSAVTNGVQVAVNPAAGKASPAASPGIILRSQKKIRRQATSKKPPQTSQLSAAAPAPAVPSSVALSSHPIQALTNPGGHADLTAASPVASKPISKKLAQTSRKSAKTNLQKSRKSL